MPHDSTNPFDESTFEFTAEKKAMLLGSDDSDAIEQSFDPETGTYRDPETGRFVSGDAPPDYDGDVDRFRGEDGRFKERSRDLGAGTRHDAPREDGRTNAFADEDAAVREGFDFLERISNATKQL